MKILKISINHNTCSLVLQPCGLFWPCIVCTLDNVITEFWVRRSKEPTMLYLPHKTAVGTTFLVVLLE